MEQRRAARRCGAGRREKDGIRLRSIEWRHPERGRPDDGQFTAIRSRMLPNRVHRSIARRAKTERPGSIDTVEAGNGPRQVKQFSRSHELSAPARLRGRRSATGADRGFRDPGRKSFSSNTMKSYNDFEVWLWSHLNGLGRRSRFRLEEPFRQENCRASEFLPREQQAGRSLRRPPGTNRKR